MATRGRVVLLAVGTLCLGAGKPGTTQVGGHTYAFPPGAFMGGEVETGAVSDMLLELAWPEMRPLTREERAAWPRRDTVRILANSAAPVAGQAVSDVELQRAVRRGVSIATTGGTGKEAAVNPPPGAALPGPGMVEAPTDEPLPGGLRNQVFVRDPATEKPEFINCSWSADVPEAAECSQSFVADSLILKVSYNRRLVAQWQDVHRRVEAFLSDHESSP